MRLSLLLIVFSFFLSSCSNHRDNSMIVYKVVDEGLKQSIVTISEVNQLIYRALEQATEDQDTRESALRWQQMAMKVKALTDSTAGYLAGLKEELKGEAAKDDKGAYKEDDIKAVNHVFNDHEKGKELFSRLVTFRKELLAVDPEFKKEFENTAYVFAVKFDPVKSGAERFTKTFVNDIPVTAAFAVLSKFENNIRSVEHSVISFCLNKSKPAMIVDDFVMPVVSLNYNTVKPGDKLELTAGIGAFSSRVKQKITIDEKEVPVDNGVATYNFRASKEPGNYRMRVVVEFLGPYGQLITLEKSIAYKVTE